MGRREFAIASAGLIAAPLLSDVIPQAQTEATAAPAGAADSTVTVPAKRSRTMRALQLTAFRRPLEVTQVPVAPPRTDGAVVRVEASGVCRSDWHFWNQDWTWMGLNLRLPTVLGHEVGGMVEEVGTDVRTIKVGDRVTIPFHESDGTCPYCRTGFQNLCENEVIPPIQRTGGWAQYITVTNADLNCIRLPDSVDTLSAAALGCRYMTAYRAVAHQGRAWSVGCPRLRWRGTLGSADRCVRGREVVAIDVSDNKLAKARDEGAVVTINARDLSPEKVGQAVKDATGGGVHVSIEALGRAFTVHQSLQSLRKRGRHVNGKRAISKAQAKVLGEQFKVSPSLFI